MSDVRKRSSTRVLPPNKDARLTDPHPQGMQIQAEVHSAPNESKKPNTESPTTKVKVSTGKSKKNVIVSVESIKGLHRRFEIKSHHKQHNRSLSDSQLTKKAGQAKKRQRMLQLGRRAFGDGRKKKADGSKIPVRQNSGDIDNKPKTEEPPVKRPLSSTPRKDKIIKQVRKIIDEEVGRNPKGSTPEGPSKNVPTIEDCFKSPGGTTTSAIASPLSVLVATEMKDPSDLLKTTNGTPKEPAIDRVLEGRSEETITDTDATKQDSKSTDSKATKTNGTEDDLYNEAIVPAKKESFDVALSITKNQSQGPVQNSDRTDNRNGESDEPREGEPNEWRSPATEARLLQIHNRKRKHHLPWTKESFRQELENSAKCKKLKRQWLHNVRAMYSHSNGSAESRASGAESTRRRTASDSLIECKQEASHQVSPMSDDDVFTPSDRGEGENSSTNKSQEWTSEAVEQALRTLQSNVDAAQRLKVSRDSADNVLKEHPMAEIEGQAHKLTRRRCSDGQYPLPSFPQSQHHLPRRPSQSSSTSTPLFDQREPVRPQPADQPPIQNLAEYFRRMRGIPPSGPQNSEASSSIPDPTPNSIQWPHITPNRGFSDFSSNFSGGHPFARRPDWNCMSSQFGSRISTESINPIFASSDSSRPSPYPCFFPSGHPSSAISTTTLATYAILQDAQNWSEKSRDCQSRAVDILAKHAVDTLEVIQSMQKELDLERSARIRLERLLREATNN